MPGERVKYGNRNRELKGLIEETLIYIFFP